MGVNQVILRISREADQSGIDSVCSEIYVALIQCVLSGIDSA